MGGASAARVTAMWAANPGLQRVISAFRPGWYLFCVMSLNGGNGASSRRWEVVAVAPPIAVFAGNTPEKRFATQPDR